MDALRRPPTVPDEIQCDSMPPWVVEKTASHASPGLQARMASLTFVNNDDDLAHDRCIRRTSGTASWVAEKTASRGNSRAQAQLDSLRFVLDDDPAHNTSRMVYDDDDDESEKHKEQPSLLPTPQQGGEEEDDGHHHSNQSGASTLGGDSCSGYCQQPRLTRQRQLQNPQNHHQVTRPAPPSYQLQERNRKGLPSAQEYPGAYAIPGTGTVATDDDNDNINDEEAPNNENTDEEQVGTFVLNVGVTRTVCGGFKRRTVIGMVMLAVVATVAIIFTVVLVVVLSNIKHNTDSNQTNATDDDTTTLMSDRFTKLQALVNGWNPGHSILYVESYLPLERPQSKALNWLVYEDRETITPTTTTSSSSSSYEENWNLNRLATRYALAVLYFSTGGESAWKDKYNFLSPSKHECNWTSSNTRNSSGAVASDDGDDRNHRQGVICNENLEITGLVLGEWLL
jgi:hypothetical protein